MDDGTGRMKGDVLAFEKNVAAPAERTILDELDRRVASATEALLNLRKDDGHWCFELEADATIPSEYVLFRHFRDEPDAIELERKIAVYLRRIQGSHGGWPLFHEGDLDMSASVKAYFALKMIGDSPDAPHMKRAREAILSRGGAARSNVFTRALLALYGEVPWRAVPTMPVEIMLLPSWFPFHLDKVSYWARTVMVPLFVLQALKPKAANRRGIHIPELFVTPPEKVRSWPKGAHQKAPWSQIFGAIDVVLKAIEPLFPRFTRRRAIEKARAFVDVRLNGKDGLGAIFPAMVNAVLMYDVLGVPDDDPRKKVARQSIDLLLVENDDEAYCQPCLSPVWDTALTTHALLETGTQAAEEAAAKALAWLKPRQILNVAGDWAARRPDVRPGGWAFQYTNAHYPDLDDTAVVVMAMDRVRARTEAAARPDFDNSIARGREWVVGLQSKDGGWGAFDADNTHLYLNNIPFADHGALLDPPTADLTARCVSMLAQLDEEAPTSPELSRGVAWLVHDQREDGSWFGRWGMNYIYGTWSALSALNAAGVAPDSPTVRAAVAWLSRIQNADGGWGEDGSSYRLDYENFEPAPSTPSQTAWALLGLMAAGEVENPAVERGIAYLAGKQQQNGLWGEERFTAVGFPRVFYLRYHGYAKFFPLWALARYRRLRRGNSRTVAYGI
jgi:squalene-hopene/tetraprenyl-beta-curcumene cyclase